MKWLILDTETTGIDETAEILEFCVIDALSGEILHDFRCNPVSELAWPGAEAVHGISPEDVASLPSFGDIWHARGLRDLLRSADRVSVYNAEFDARLIEQSLCFDFDGQTDNIRWDCIMLRYAARLAVPSSRGGWRWHKLTDAAEHVGHTWHGAAHSARADCLAARSVALWLEGVPPLIS